MSDRLIVWAAGDAHVGTDVRRGRRSLAEAIIQSEEDADGFVWDLMLDVGDLSGGQTPPGDDEGALVVDQYRALREHRREQVYNVAGNHDASGPGEKAQWWFQRYGDPLGENTRYSGVDPARRPYPVEGAWDHYRFEVGNLLFLMLSDRNDGGPPIGRGERGGYPAGAVTREQFDWWIEQVEAHPDRIIVTVHHHMLKETTVASGLWEGFGEGPDRYGKRGQGASGYHGYFPDGGPMGASYLYWCDGNPDAQAFERYLAANPGAIDLWLGGHTHTHPDDTWGGRSHIERKWNVTHVNCAALTKFHSRPHATPMSRVLEFTEGRDEVRIRCYLHTDEYARQGWYDAVERTVPLRMPFRR